MPCGRITPPAGHSLSGLPRLEFYVDTCAKGVIHLLLGFEFSIIAKRRFIRRAGELVGKQQSRIVREFVSEPDFSRIAQTGRVPGICIGRLARICFLIFDTLLHQADICTNEVVRFGSPRLGVAEAGHERYTAHAPLIMPGTIKDIIIHAAGIVTESQSDSAVFIQSIYTCNIGAYGCHLGSVVIYFPSVYFLSGIKIIS